ncbi:MAG: hypothetical protein SGI71_10180 [Verrucomicrobiota bacterium]|nr:hypothetical protein [Verrucomicrobiota bacterium]
MVQAFLLLFIVAWWVSPFACAEPLSSATKRADRSKASRESGKKYDTQSFSSKSFKAKSYDTPSAHIKTYHGTTSARVDKKFTTQDYSDNKSAPYASKEGYLGESKVKLSDSRFQRMEAVEASSTLQDGKKNYVKSHKEYKGPEADRIKQSQVTVGETLSVDDVRKILNKN